MKRLLHLFRIGIVSYLFLFYSNTLFSQNSFTQQWNKVSSLERSGDVKGALKVVETIFETSLSTKNYSQVPRAISAIRALEIKLNWKVKEDIYKRFSDMKDQFEKEGFEAEFYYLKSMITLEMNHLARDRYMVDTLITRIDKVIEISEKLKRFKAYRESDPYFYEHYLDGQKCDNLQQEALLWATKVMRDFLYYNDEVIDYYNDKLYPALIQALVRNKNLKLKADYQKFKYDILGKNKQRLELLEEFAESAPDVFSKVEIMFDLASAKISFVRGQPMKEIGRSDKQEVAYMNEAIKLLEDIIKRYPKSSYAENSRIMLEDLRRKSVYLLGNKLEIISYPLDTINILIGYQNVSEINVNIYRVDDSKVTSGISDNNAYTFVNKSNRVKTYRIDVSKNSSGILNYTILSLMNMDKGLYILELQGGEEDRYNVLRITTVGSAVLSDRGGRRYFVFDNETGKPLDNVRVRFFSNIKINEYNGNIGKEYSDRKFSQDGFTMFDSEDSIKQDSYYQFYTVSGNGAEDVYTPILKLNNRSSNSTFASSMNRSEIFTDRKLYKPNDTIYFKGIAYSADKEDYNVLKNYSDVVRIYGPDHESIQDIPFTTNDMGSFNGYFVLPERSMTGRYYIKATVTGGVSYFYIEDYKPPTFMVELDKVEENYKFGDTIKVIGRAKNYAGFNLRNFQVNYSVSVERNMNYYAEQSGTISIDDSDDFVISFVAKPPKFIDKRSDAYSDYVVEANIVDITGETYRGMVEFRVEDRPIKLSMNLDKNILKEANEEIVLKITNTSGTEQKLSGIYTVSSKGAPSEKSIQGSFVSGEPILPNWSELPSGEYEVECSLSYRGDLYSKKEIIYLMSKVDTQLYADRELLIKPLKNDRKFILGTSEDRMYVEMIIYCLDSIIYRQPIVIEQGVKVFEIPKHIQNRYDRVLLSLFTVRRGRKHIWNEEYILKQKGAALEIKLITTRDKTIVSPGAEEQVHFEIRNRSSLKAELLLSIFNKSTDRLGENKFSLQKMYNVNIPQAQLTYEEYRIRKIEYDREYVVELSDITPSRSIVIGYGPVNKGLQKSDVKIDIRSNFSETLMFLPDYRVSSDTLSKISIPFKTSDLMSTFNILAFVHNQKMDTAGVRGEIIVQKDVMIISNYPQFLRERDKIFLQANVVNLTEENVSGTAYIEVNATSTGEVLTDKVLCSNNEHLISLKPGEQRYVKWEVSAEQMSELTNITFCFSSPKHFDAERHTIPVLSMRDQFTDVDSYILADEGKYVIKSNDKVISSESEDRELMRVTLEVVSPLISAVTSMAAIGADNDSENSIGILASIYVNALGNYMFKKDSGLRSIIEDYISQELVGSPLELNEEITGVLLSETPWTDIPGRNRARIMALKNMMDDEISKKTNERLFLKLKGLQLRGAFTWYSGSPQSAPITLLILDKYAELIKLGAILLNDIDKDVFARAIGYCDKYIGSIYERGYTKYVWDNSVERTLNNIYPLISYMSFREVYSEIVPVTEKTDSIIRFMEGFLSEHLNRGTIMQKAIVASYFLEKKDYQKVALILNTLDHYIVKNKTVGYYFPNAVMPFRGMLDSEIKAHSYLLNIYRSVSKSGSIEAEKREHYSEIATGLTHWLLLQNRNQMWGNNVATIDAIYSLLMSGEEIPDYSINFVNRSLNKNLPVNNNRLFNRFDIPVNNFSNKKEGDIATIKKGNRGLMFVNVFYNYIDDYDNVDAVSNGFQIDRKFYRKEISDNKIVLIELKEGEELRAGEELMVKYFIDNKENRHFVQLKAMRTACLMPVVERSGYQRSGPPAGYYKDMKKNISNYYFYFLPEGEYTIEERFFVTQRGTFSMGWAEIRSIYAPEYGGRTYGNIEYTILN